MKKEILIQKTNTIINWQIISIIELFIILLLIIILFVKFRKKSDKEVQIENFKNSNIDMDNIMMSINKSEELFKTLSKYCHPDRHTKSEKHIEIEKLYQEIVSNKRNYNKLIELKSIAETTFNLKIN
jgi:hypothetical protein